MVSKTNRRIPRLGNGVMEGRVAFIKAAGLQARYGVVESIRTGFHVMTHNVRLKRLDNGAEIHEFGMNLKYLDEEAYLERKRLLEVELTNLTQAWEKQIQLQSSGLETDAGGGGKTAFQTPSTVAKPAP